MKLITAALLLAAVCAAQMMPGPTVVIWKTTFGDPSMSPAPRIPRR